MKRIVLVLLLAAGCTAPDGASSKPSPRKPRHYSAGDCFQIAEFQIKVVAVDSTVEKVVFVPYSEQFECYARKQISLDFLAMDTLAKIECPLAKYVCKSK